MKKVTIKFISDGSVTRIEPDRNFTGFEVGNTVYVDCKPYVVLGHMYFRNKGKNRPGLYLHIKGYVQPIDIDQVSRSCCIDLDNEPRFIFT